jgi:hypothetical protein
MFYVVSFTLLGMVLALHVYFTRRDRQRQAVCVTWLEADERLSEYVQKFQSELETHASYEPSTSLEEIDMTYKTLVRKKHLAQIAYLEMRKSLVDKGELLVLLEEIGHDPILCDRVLNLIFFRIANAVPIRYGIFWLMVYLLYTYCHEHSAQHPIGNH